MIDLDALATTHPEAARENRHLREQNQRVLDRLRREGDAPDTWTDDQGRTWKTSRILRRLKPSKCPGHAALRDFVIRRDGGKCRWCGATEMLVADHIISRRNGGAHHPDNLRTLCDSCNAAKVGLVDARGKVVA